MQTQAVYEQRLCAFVDILGFRDLVLRSYERPALQTQIRQLLREVVLAQPVWERDSPVDLIEARLVRQGVSNPKFEAERLVKEYAAAERGSSFSDSLVLSATLNDRAITGLVTSLLFLSRGVAELGKYVRGAVCVGPLCHEQSLCFGPAVIDAYDLEKKADYPRIVFTAEAHAAVTAVHFPSVGPLASYVREDADGERFLDFLNRAALDLAGSFRETQMWEIRHQLARQLSSSETPNGVRRKLVWLADYFNSVLKEAPIAGINPLPSGT
jgi:hypothetical protein